MKPVQSSENNLLERKEYVFEVDHAGAATPKREELKKQIAESLGVAPEKVSIVEVRTGYGANSSIVFVRVYADENVLKLFEKPKGKKPQAGAAK